MKTKLTWAVGALVLVAVAAAFYASLNEPGNLWIVTHVFAGCPAKPACASSAATDAVHRIEPLHYAGDAATAREKLEAVVRGMPRTSVEHATPEYLHVLFQTRLMHFHDDVELLVQPGGVIQVRSISRFGYGDHGVNRARVEEIRQAFGQ